MGLPVGQEEGERLENRGYKHMGYTSALTVVLGADSSKLWGRGRVYSKETGF